VKASASHGQNAQLDGRVSRHACGVGADLYRRLFESVGVGVAYVGPEDGIIVRCNAAYAKLLGSTLEKVEGRSFFDFLSGEQEAKARRERERRLRGVSSKYEVTLSTDGGKEHRLLATGVPLYGDSSYLGAVQTLQDVTECHRTNSALQESERRHRFIFTNASVGMALLAPEGDWLSVNGKLCEILGFSEKQFLSGMTWRDITHPDDLDADLELAGLVLSGKMISYSLEKRYLSKDGRVVWAKLTVWLKRSPSGEPDCFASMVEDITKRKLKELVPDPLTGRELEVLKQVARLCTDREIAKKFNYCEGTIKSDVRQILRKLRVTSRRQAARKAIEVGLIRPLH